MTSKFGKPEPGHKRAEKEFREVEARYRSIFENAITGIFQITPDGSFLAANPKLASMLGYGSPGELMNEINDIRRLFADPVHLDELIRLIQTQKVVVDFTIQICRKDGSRIWASVNAWSLRDASGKIAGFEGMLVDITERWKAIEAMRESEIKFRSVTQSAIDAIISADTAGNIISWNKGAQTIFGYTEEEASGRSLIILIPEKYREPHRKGLERVNATGETRIIGKTVELSGLRKDGSEFPLELSLSTWKTAEGRFYTGIVRDITERKRAEEMLKNYATALEEANRLKDLFTDIMRHDLLNPLNVIRMTDELLLEKTRDDDMHKSLLMIKRNSDKLIEMIKNASMYAKLESADKLEKSRLDLNAIFRTVADNFKPQMDEKNIQLGYLPENEYYAMVNPMIEDVFSNLLDNAIKYSPQGSRVEINITDENGFYRIYVKDWGYGIKEEDRDKLFTRFQRVAKKGVKGTGLGLAIVKRIVKLHGGRVWIEDNPEGGSIFYVEIPKA